MLQVLLRIEEITLTAMGQLKLFWQGELLSGRITVKALGIFCSNCNAVLVWGGVGLVFSYLYV